MGENTLSYIHQATIQRNGLLFYRKKGNRKLNSKPNGTTTQPYKKEKCDEYSYLMVEGTRDGCKGKP